MDKPSAKERLAAMEAKLAEAEAEKARLADELQALKSKTPDATAFTTTDSSPTPTPAAPAAAAAPAGEPAVDNSAAYGWFFVGAIITLVGMLVGRVIAHSAWGRD
jgi:hypothetical protein